MPNPSKSPLRIALVQMTATNDLKANVTKMRQFAERANKERADIVVFPEMAYFYGSAEDNSRSAEAFESLKAQFSGWARELKLTLVPGSLREPVKGDAHHHYNTACVFGPSGELLGQYRKIFLFKAVLPDRTYDEAERVAAGTDAVVIDFPWGKLGLSICYDLRFPELFRRLKKKGADVVLLPSAFTVPTGKAHWRTLVTARAIENQFFVLAPGQTGVSGEGAAKYGHSLAVSPWGDVIAELAETEEVRVVELDLSEPAKARSKVDAWQSRREEIFPL